MQAADLLGPSKSVLEALDKIQIRCELCDKQDVDNAYKLLDIKNHVHQVHILGNIVEKVKEVVQPPPPQIPKIITQD